VEEVAMITTEAPDRVGLGGRPRPAIRRRGERAGHDVQFERLASEHGDALLRYARGLTGSDGQAAEDIVQEVLLVAWQRLATLDADRSVRPWLCTVARNRAVSRWRARQARPVETGEDDLADLPAAGSADDEDAALTRRVMLAAIGTLRREHRDVLFECFYCGRTITEAAAALGIPAGTVRSRRFHALAALRAELRRTGLDAPMVTRSVHDRVDRAGEPRAAQLS
jgi:RNA polymerase sigma-70 factor, ECF subfamily